MNIQELLGELPASIKDPFKPNNIYYIELKAFRSSRGKWLIDGQVDFKNENTEGTQRFTANTMGELYLKIQEFINSME